MSSKPDPLPAVRGLGFCAGCKQFVERLVLVAAWRYRCDACALKDPGHG